MTSTGSFDASKHPRANSGPGGGRFVTAPKDETSLGSDGVDLLATPSIPSGTLPRVASTFETLTQVDENGRRYVTDESAWGAAEKARLDDTTAVLFSDLDEGDSFVVEENDRLIEYRLRKDPTAFTNRDGEVERYVDVDNMSRGGSRLLRFGDGQMAARVPKAIYVKTDAQVTEADLNRGYGL